MRYFFLIIAFLLPAITIAQLTAPGMRTVRYTSYPSAPTVKDPLFIYCNTSGSQTGALNASKPGGTGLYNFTWYKWNNTLKNFSDALKTDPGVANSSINNLSEGGYKVDIDSAGIFDTSLVGWIFFDQRPVSVAKLANPLKHCDYVALDGTANLTIAKFYYYDPGTGLQLSLQNELKFLWSSDPVSIIPAPDFYLDPVSYSPPLVDVTYNLKVNSLGCSNDSSFFYESIHVKAEFSADPVKGEAPLEVVFTDKSIRGDKYFWEFGESKDSISKLNNPEPHIYYKPGEYSVKLTIESERGCIDSIRFDKIVVDDSKLEIPNVFTPDGDGLNDNFIVESRSLRYISVEVFSRSGMKVYSFFGEGKKLAEWSGWDGNVNQSSVKATPGIYFYVIRAYGWDDIDYNSKDHRGFVYLYR